MAFILGTTIDNLLGTKPVTTSNYVHGDNRAAKIQELFDILNPVDQRAVLKHITCLIAQYDNTNNNEKLIMEEG